MLRNKKCLFLSLILLILVGCQPVCNAPYTEFKKGECCLDSNTNHICDNDEDKVQLADANIQPVNSVKIPELENCPYSCCTGNDYKKKSCSEGYKCIENECIELDTDNDGLNDLIEKSIGTNIKLSDSDNDGLNDAIEVNIKKTNPLSDNTDNDRYNDYEDKNPLITNSANILIEAKKEDNPALNLKLITSSAVALASVELGNVAGVAGGLNIIGELWNKYKQSDIRTIKFTIKNEGEDYSAYTKFDLYIKYSYLKDDTVIEEKNLFLKSYNLQEKIESHATIERADVFSLKALGDYIDTSFPEPSQCSGFFTFCDESAEYNIQNLDFDKFPK